MEAINTVLINPINNTLQTAALLLAQVLAGMCKYPEFVSMQFYTFLVLLYNIAQESNIIGALSSMFGKRDFWADLGDSLLTTVTDTANTLLSGRINLNCVKSEFIKSILNYVGLALQLAISLGKKF